VLLAPIFPKEGATPFDVIVVNFITKLPVSSGHDTILTVTDHDCLKVSIFIPCNKEISGEEMATLYAKILFP
jgi:hypothetical protein